MPELEWLEPLFTLSSLPLLELEGLEELELELELELLELDELELELEGLSSLPRRAPFFKLSSLLELEELELEELEELELELEELELEELELELEELELELEELEEPGLEVLELVELGLLVLELGELVLEVLELDLEAEEPFFLDFDLDFDFFLLPLAMSCFSPSRVSWNGLALVPRGASVLACWTAIEGMVAAVARTRATARRCAIHSARLGDFIRPIERTELTGIRCRSNGFTKST